MWFRLNVTRDAIYPNVVCLFELFLKYFFEMTFFNIFFSYFSLFLSFFCFSFFFLFFFFSVLFRIHSVDYLTETFRFFLLYTKLFVSSRSNLSSIEYEREVCYSAQFVN